MQPDTICLDRHDGVLTLTLCRPATLNAFNPAMLGDLLAAFNEADRDDAVRAVVVTGSGRAFCSGSDISSGAATFDFDSRPDKAALGSPMQANGSINYGHEAVRDNGGRLTLRIFASLKPVIAAVNGVAVGIGATMLLPMDVRLAAEGARFAFPFARRGIVPEAASSWFLPRIVGISRAIEWCASGRMIGADEALTHGLIHSIHAPDTLLGAAQELAAEMTVDSAPVSVALTRQMMWRGLTMPEPFDAHRVDSRGVYSRGRSNDAREGITSFREKRRPRFPEKVSDAMPDFFPWWTERHFD